MRTAQSRQKSYVDHRRRDLEFSMGDHVFIRVALLKGVMRFGKREKLTPIFIGPFEILDQVGALGYRMALPPNLDGVHNVFPVSMLRNSVPSGSGFAVMVDFDVKIPDFILSSYRLREMRKLDES
ncbi:uncharacterized protein [Henckelia pumila]|uniref:uncharacterized protein n=1 Tax=Henckelia pumila TaxID=405737 RepID=UPI003C6EA267